jgi:hypothetical protein
LNQAPSGGVVRYQTVPFEPCQISARQAGAGIGKARMAKVSLVLAAAAGLPEGSTEDRVELHMCLTPQGLLDAMAFQPDIANWPTAHYRPSGLIEHGELVRLDGSWALRDGEGEDAPLWSFDGRVIRPGEYVTLRGPRGEEMTYRIVAVEAD